MGGTIFVYGRAVESESGEVVRGRAGTRVDRAIDAAARGCFAFGRAYQRSGYSDLGDFGGEFARVSRCLGAGDARPVHAGSGVDRGARIGWVGWRGTICGLSAVGGVAEVAEGGWEE